MILSLFMTISTFATGSGTSDDPFIIYGCDELQLMNGHTTSYFKLANDIDCSGYSYSPFTFSGELDGAGHKIMNLNSPLYSALNGNGYIHNFTLVNGSITNYANYNAPVVMRNYARIEYVGVENYVVYGIDGIGGFVGRAENSNSVIKYSYTKNIKLIPKNDGSSQEVGGFIGHNGDGKIYECYVDTPFGINADSQVGGFVGRNYGYIYDSFAKTGLVQGNHEIGGFVGYNGNGNHDSKIYRSYSVNQVNGGNNARPFVGYNNGYSGKTGFYDTYYDKDVFGNIDNFGSKGLSTSEMKDFSNFDGYKGFDFKNIWYIDSNINDGYMFLRKDTKNFDDSNDWVMIGDGSSSNPYQITTCKQLYNIRNNDDLLNKNFVLVNNINCLNIPFDPIGDTGNHKFKGNFNGQNYNISNTQFALFEYIDSGASVTNLNIIDAQVVKVSTDCDGILSRYNAGTIENVFTNGIIGSIKSYIGGLVGQQQYGGIIRSSKSYADVIGNTGTSNDVGGLVGRNYDSYIYESESYNNLVQGHSRVGGFIGRNAGYIYDSLSHSTNIKGYSEVGGFVGYIGDGSHQSHIYRSYSTGKPYASSGNNVNGFVGYLYKYNNNDYYSKPYDVIYDKVTSTMTDTYYSKSYTTSQLNDIRYLSGDIASYDFINIWYFDNNTGYPELRKLNGVSPINNVFTIGDGSSSNPYQITNCNQLMLITDNDIHYYSLMNNIDCSQSPMKRKNFKGNFNGNNNEISYTYIPLFENVKDGGKVYNLGIVNHNSLNPNYDYYGVLSRYIDNNADVEGIWVSGTIVTNRNYIGGISGRVNNAILKNSRSYVDVTGNDNIGGVTGYVDGNGKLYSTSAYGDINGHNQVGGAVGYIRKGYVYDTFSKSDNINGNENVGGIVGYMYGGSSSSRTYMYRGYWEGTHLIGNSNVGGAIGRDGGSYAYPNSLYWDKEKSGITGSSGGGATGLTNAQMITQSSFSGFDFNTIWVMDSNIGGTPNHQALLPLNIQDFNVYINYPTNNEIINLNNSMETITFQYLHDSNSSDVSCKLYIDGVLYDSRNNVGQSIQSFTLNRWKSKSYELKVTCSDSIIEKTLIENFIVNVEQDLLTGNPNNNNDGGVSSNANINISEILDAINNLNLSVVVEQGETQVIEGDTKIYHNYDTIGGELSKLDLAKLENITSIIDARTNKTINTSNKKVIDVTGLYNTLLLQNGTMFENLRPTHFYRNVLDKPFIDSNEYGVENDVAKTILDNIKTWEVLVTTTGGVAWGMSGITFGRKTERWIRFRNKSIVVGVVSFVIMALIKIFAMLILM